MKHLNIEIKAECREPQKVRSILEARGADFKGTDHQIDTYFKSSSGRLKLREGNIENYLVYYQRTDQAGPKQSDVTLYPTEPDTVLKDIMIGALGVLAVVDKQREIYFIDNVKFHIDTVQELGTFVEIEAIDEDGMIGESRLNEQCQEYLELFAISDKDLIELSYSDLLLSK